MRRLLNRHEGPPVDSEGRSFRYIHPETGHKSWGNDYDSWLIAARDHIRANKLAMPDDLAATAEDQLCGTLPPHLCLYEQGDPPPTDTRITFEKVLDWVRTVAAKIVSGQSYVEKAESERRAGICVQCPYNVLVVGGCGTGCNKKVAEFFTPGMSELKTTQDLRLKSCAVCSCFLRILVHFPIASLKEDDNVERQASLPQFCWRKRGGINFQS